MGHAFYGDLSKEEIKKAIKGNNMQAFIPAYIIGLIFILVGIVAFNGKKGVSKAPPVKSRFEK